MHFFPRPDASSQSSQTLIPENPIEESAREKSWRLYLESLVEKAYSLSGTRTVTFSYINPNNPDYFIHNDLSAMQISPARSILMEAFLPPDQQFGYHDEYECKIPQLLEYVEKLHPNVTSDPAYLQLKDNALKDKYYEYFYADNGARCDSKILITPTKDVGHNILEIELFPAHLLYPRM